MVPYIGIKSVIYTMTRRRKMGDKRCTNEKCQAENSSMSKFCMKCGTPLQDAVKVEEKKIAISSNVEEPRGMFTGLS